MKQIDFIGGVSVAGRPFKDIRSTRSTTAERKAELVLSLGKLINKAPPRIASGGSIDQVRAWRTVRDQAAKVAGNSRSSVFELEGAITRMRSYFDSPAA